MKTYTLCGRVLYNSWVLRIWTSLWFLVKFKTSVLNSSYSTVLMNIEYTVHSIQYVSVSDLLYISEQFVSTVGTFLSDKILWSLLLYCNSNFLKLFLIVRYERIFCYSFPERSQTQEYCGRVWTSISSRRLLIYSVTVLAYGEWCFWSTSFAFAREKRIS